MTGLGDSRLDCLRDCSSGHSISDTITFECGSLISFTSLEVLNVLCMTSDGISQTGNGAGIGCVPLNSSTSRIDARLLTCGGGTKALQSDLAINNLDGLAIAKDGRTDCLQGLVRLNNVQVGGRFRYDANIFAIKISAVRTTDFNSGSGGSFSSTQRIEVITCVQRERSLRIK